MEPESPLSWYSRASCLAVLRAEPQLVVKWQCKLKWDAERQRDPQQQRDVEQLVERFGIGYAERDPDSFGDTNAVWYDDALADAVTGGQLEPHADVNGDTHTHGHGNA